MEVTSNHIDAMGLGHVPDTAEGDNGEEISRRVDKFGAPVSQSESVLIFRSKLLLTFLA